MNHTVIVCIYRYSSSLYKLLLLQDIIVNFAMVGVLIVILIIVIIVSLNFSSIGRDGASDAPSPSTTFLFVILPAIVSYCSLLNFLLINISLYRLSLFAMEYFSSYLLWYLGWAAHRFQIQCMKNRENWIVDPPLQLLIPIHILQQIAHQQVQKLMNFEIHDQLWTIDI